jgi:uncharacterized protein YecE (DUF72 family)
MHFGRNEIDITNFDHHLPADSVRTLRVFENAEPVGDFEAFVGAPKWGYKNWIGSLYPKGTKDADFLRNYARYFNTVELGATFYQPQPRERIAAWKEMVQDIPDFKFCPKFPQSITHIRRFRNVEEQTNEFYTNISVFGKHLGPLFLQLADNFSPKSFPELRSYLSSLPSDAPLYIEVRNKSWFAAEEHRNSLFNLLSDLNIGAVVSDTAGRRDCLHMELTIPHAFIRFVNCGDERTDLLRLDEWVKRLKAWKQTGLKSLYFFIHAGDAPSLSLYDYFIDSLNRELGLKIQTPGQSLK